MSSSTSQGVTGLTSPVVIESYDDVRAVMRDSRQQRGMSCAELAAELGCAASLISLREGGKRIAPTDDLIETFRALGKTVVVVDTGAGAVDLLRAQLAAHGKRLRLELVDDEGRPGIA